MTQRVRSAKEQDQGPSREAPGELTPSSSEVHALMDGIASAPEDDLHRVMLSDYFLERGDPYGRFVLEQVNAHRATNHVDNSGWRKLLFQHPEWLPPGVEQSSVKFSRGVMTEARVIAATDPNHIQWINAEVVELVSTAPSVLAIFQIERRRLRVLRGATPVLLGAMAMSAHSALESISMTLDLWDTTGALFDQLKRLTRLSALELLYSEQAGRLPSRRAYPYALETMSQLPRLKCLRVRMSTFDTKAMRDALERLPTWPSTRVIAVVANAQVALLRDEVRFLMPPLGPARERATSVLPWFKREMGPVRLISDERQLF